MPSKKKLDKGVEVISGGPGINGAHPSSFNSNDNLLDNYCTF